MTKTFVKRWDLAPEGLFASEYMGLEWLNVPGGPRVVRPICYDQSHIELELLKEGPPTPDHAFEFGRRLKILHNSHTPSAIPRLYGQSPYRNQLFFGPQRRPLIFQMRPTDNFFDYFVQSKMEPLFGYAGTMVNAADRKLFDRAVSKCQSQGMILFDSAIVHGDLWGGNVFWTAEAAIMIDPAARTGHPFEDLAMLDLFGVNFFTQILQGYFNDNLPTDLEYQFKLHNLFPILAHAVLFGGGYYSQFLSNLYYLA
ncbi:MAG: fructosamine kinase family protein [Bifidobacteriaceae bacterium]|jgi:fructosamine-3-kinase|nr:fructosamine kinase family protein [Bifidobacteriaceae bacterium]